MIQRLRSTVLVCSTSCVLAALAGCGGASNESVTSDATTVLVASTSTTDGLTEDADASSGRLFVASPDLAEGSECDIFAQDCSAGLKCSPWAIDGDSYSYWNATRCTLIVDHPAEIGEPCHAVGSRTSGIDDCGLGALCYFVDIETLEGTCLPLCEGSPSNTYCSDPGFACDIVDGDSLVMCLPLCDPLAQACDEGRGCYPIHSRWQCVLDGSSELGAYGDPCLFDNQCAPGLVCLDDSTVPPGQACEGATECCTEICDLSDPAGDLQCAGAAGGQICVPWYAEGTAPPGFEDVGACTLPT